MPACCRCNASGKCRTCRCIKSGKSCQGCLPQRLGKCENSDTFIRSPQNEETSSSSSSSIRHSQIPCELVQCVEDTSSVITSDIYETTTDNLEAFERGNSCNSNHPIGNLPGYPEFQEYPDFIWGSVDGTTFTNKINAAYDEAIHWQTNIFKLPFGKEGKAFVNELARLFRAYAESSSMEIIALKAAMTLPILLLQKPHRTSKVKEHNKCIERRLSLWLDGDIEALLDEGRTIQRYLHPQIKRSSDRQDATVFTRFMSEGKVRAALHMLSSQSNNGSLALDTLIDSVSVKEILQKKHPPAQPLDPTALISYEDPIEEPHPVIFDKITGSLIRSISLRTEGSAGPSKLDAKCWRRICTSFHGASIEICNSLAAIAKRLCSSYVNPSGLIAFTASRLIALDKCPGVRPIGVGEVIRRIVGKAILSVIGYDIQEAAGAIQLCAGQQAGCESAVHAMREILANPDTEGILLVDANNAFNNQNRNAALLNIKSICPSLSKILINTYRNSANLYVDGETIQSNEGTTQGDPLAMAMYSVAIMPLIKQLNGVVKQIWYADDASAGGRITDLRVWWNRLQELGPRYGYFVNSFKSHLLVKDDNLAIATNIFCDTDIQVSTAGHRYLGAPLGSESFIESYITSKVSEWSAEIYKLAELANTQPQAAYGAFTHGLIGRWVFIMRTVPNIGDLLSPLEHQTSLSTCPFRETSNK